MDGCNSVLLTDFYQLTMAQALWDSGKSEEESVFYLFFRRAPFKGSYAIFSGLYPVTKFIEGFQFLQEDIDYLESLKNNKGSRIFKKKFLIYLKNLKLSVNLSSVKEGSIVFPFEPLIRVQGPILQCQILETALLNLVNFSTLISTKASRVRLAARNDEVIEFGLRRAQGPDGGLTATRASIIGGLNSTSNVLAGKLFKIPVKGTHSHSWVMSFPREIDSFFAFSKSMPEGCIFLVDTYSTIEGVKNAIIVGKKLRENGHEMVGIRLDSGDLIKLSRKSRKLLDDAGFINALIVASGDLDEYEIERLKNLKCPIDIWGVGTRLVTSFDQPALDGVYKLGAIKDKSGKWDFKMKTTDQDSKITLPGVIQIRRFFDSKGAFRDILYNQVNPPATEHISFVDIKEGKKGVIPKGAKWEDLLIPIFQKGKIVYSSPNLFEIQCFATKSLAQFRKDILKLKNPKCYPLGLEKKLYDLRNSLIKKIKGEK